MVASAEEKEGLEGDGLMGMEFCFRLNENFLKVDGSNSTTIL